MDDDDFRRGKPATHRAFDEAIAILAADAMQPLAFRMLATAPALLPYPEAQTQLVALLAEACGPNGISGGQALDLAAESRYLDPAELEHMYRLKTGRLLRASTLVAAFCPPGASRAQVHALERFADALGVAYQIRDDMLDVTAPDKIGAQPGSDLVKDKATYPGLYGMDRARSRADELLAAALGAIEAFGAEADGLRDMARYAVLRED
jgi:farnesyl diphosphate synthase